MEGSAARITALARRVLDRRRAAIVSPASRRLDLSEGPNDQQAAWEHVAWNRRRFPKTTRVLAPGSGPGRD
jgi:hypothetical protein